MEIRNDYTDDDKFTHIDYWQTDDDNEGGRTIAIVCRDTKKVFFIDNSFRMNEEVKKAIDEVLKTLEYVPDSRYPQCEKLKANQDKSLIISEFLDFLSENNVVLGQWVNKFGKTGFDIDEKELERERQDIINHLKNS